jgi:hypothetical protein
MNKLTPPRRKVVVLAASVACMSSGGPVLFKGHPKLMMGWTAFMIAVLAYTIWEFAKLKRSER